MRQRIREARWERARTNADADLAKSAPEHLALFERIRQGGAIICKPESDAIARLMLSALKTKGQLRVEVAYRDGRHADLAWSLDGRLLKGGLTTVSDEEISILRSTVDALVALPPESRLPSVIILPRSAFVPGTRTPAEHPGVGGGGGPRLTGPHDERIDFLNQFRDKELTRFQFGPEARTFAGYVCAVYPGGFRLDIPEWGGAAFDYSDPDILPRLGIHPSQKSLSSQEQGHAQQYITEHILPHGINKRGFVQKGAERHPHGKNWWEEHEKKIRKLFGAA